MDRRLIDHFVNANLLSRQDMQRIILRASKDKNTLVEELLSADLVHEDVVAQQVAKFYRKETLSAQGFRVDPMALNLITGEIAKKGGVLPFAFNDSQDQLFVAAFDLEASAEVLQILEKTTGVPPEVRLAPKSWVMEAIDHYYFKAPQEAAQNRQNSRAQQRNGRSNVNLRASFVGEPSQPKLRSLSKYDVVDDLDDFLSNDTPRVSKEAPDANSSFGELSGLGANFWEDPNTSRWSFEAEQAQQAQQAAQQQAKNSSSSPGRQAKTSFDLFEEPKTADKKGRDLTLQEIVERQHERISTLTEELQRQRDVIQVLADLLVDARVISSRELKQRLRDKRKG